MEGCVKLRKKSNFLRFSSAISITAMFNLIPAFSASDININNKHDSENITQNFLQEVCEVCQEKLQEKSKEINKNNINNKGDELSLTKNQSVLNWIEEMKKLVNPKDIIWIDGSENQIKKLYKKACENNELIELNQEKMPGCYLHRTALNDVARAEDRTFICTKTREEAGPTNNWKDPQQAYELLYNIARNSYKNKTMYVIPYSMGVPGSEFSKIGIEITDSIYAVLNMNIMTRVGQEVLDELDDLGENYDGWVRGLHCSCNIDENKRYVCHFPQDNTIISVNSGYGGNVLLGKKCLALRIASYLGRKEKWLAEHMLILGIQKPDGEIIYVCAAFPSACGKTNLAMIIPPEIYQKQGYKVWCVGDDIAWLRIGDDGRLWAINPENGFFGVAPGTNNKSNPNAMQTISHDTIYTNVVQNLDDNTVWWEGMGNNPPANAIDWTGEFWNGQTSNHKGAHPNSRFTAPAKNCPIISPEFDNPNGVPISAIIFGGRRSDTIPLVYESRDWNHGVFIGSTISSETTAAITGQVGVLRHDPMAMISFCGYNMSDYFEHWISMGKLLGDKAPKIFGVNWFRKDDAGKFLWPGYGDNFRVLDWIIKRCENKLGARETPIGYVPHAQDINIKDLDIHSRDLVKLLELDISDLEQETLEINKFYNKTLENNIPVELRQELNNLQDNL